jgi:protein involved in polysaccharide export with SLBB domain
MRKNETTPKKSIRLFLILGLLFALQPGGVEAKTKKKTSTDASSPFQVVPEAHESESVPLSNGYPPILIGPGDLLTINVYGETALATEYQVDANGEITFPYLGAIKLANLTPNEASDKLANALFKPRKVSILIKESNTYWISVIGEVGKAGKYQIRGKPNLLSTLSEAGGPLNDSDLSQALIIHQDVRTRVDLNQFLKGSGPTLAEPYLYPGDVLFVPKEGWPANAGDFLTILGGLASVFLIVIDIQSIH